MAITIDNEIYIKVTEAATFIDRSTTTVYNNYKKWNWTDYEYDGSIIFKKAEVEQWLKDRVKLRK